jgi:hypothetical protein
MALKIFAIFGPMICDSWNNLDEHIFPQARSAQ